VSRQKFLVLTVAISSGVTPNQNSGALMFWTFFGYPFWDVPIWLALPMGLGIIAQWSLLAMLLWRFQQTLHRLRAVNQMEARQAN